MQHFYYGHTFLCNVEPVLFYQLICFFNYEHYYVTARRHTQACIKPHKDPAYPKYQSQKENNAPFNHGLVSGWFSL
jgi:hypothetical protein